MTIPPRPVWANANDALPQSMGSAIDPVINTYPVDLAVMKPYHINTGSQWSVQKWLETTGSTGKVPPLALAAVSFWRAAPTAFPGGSVYKSWSYHQEETTTTEEKKLKGTYSQLFEDGGALSVSGDNTTSQTVVITTSGGDSRTLTVPQGQTHYEVVWQWVTRYAYIPQSQTGDVLQAQPFVYDYPYWDIGGNNYGYAVGFAGWIEIPGQAIVQAYDFYDNTGEPVNQAT